MADELDKLVNSANQIKALAAIVLLKKFQDDPKTVDASFNNRLFSLTDPACIGLGTKVYDAIKAGLQIEIDRLTAQLQGIAASLAPNLQTTSAGLHIAARHYPADPSNYLAAASPDFATVTREVGL